MSDPTDTSLDNCGCCEPDPVPAPISNRPGLPALSYRAGTYATFFRRMLAGLGRYILPDGDFAGTRPLLPLTTRAEDDPSIALLDASSVVADVLTFYQERIANEGFLRTATERRSILELARAIGYELNPGVAASVYLAFTIENAAGSPDHADIPAGTKVQSVPPQNQLPQTFETSADITAYAAWNELHPRLGFLQTLYPGAQQVSLQGTSTNLKNGDRVLIDAAGWQWLLTVEGVEAQADRSSTLVTLDGWSAPVFAPPAPPQGTVDISQKIAFSRDAVEAWIIGQQWTDSELNAFLQFNDWDRNRLLDTLAERRSDPPAASTDGVYAMRASAGFFGNSAPAFASLPSTSGSFTVNYGQNWDQYGWQIWLDQQAANTSTYYSDSLGVDVFLDKVVQGLLADSGAFPFSWIAFDYSGYPAIFRIASKVERSLAAFAMSGKTTGISLETAAGGPVSNTYKSGLYFLQVRNTVAYLASELLPLAELPMAETLDSDPTRLGLDGLVLGLTAGQPVILSGERSDAPGVTVSEVLIISDVNHIAGFTELTFQTGRQYDYKRSTLVVNANVAPATNGETVTEILGNGDGSQVNQRFTLKRPPLTYTAASTPSGSASTLQLRVNNLLWDEASSLYPLGPKDQDYIIRMDNDAKATVIFGDGSKGARLPSGVNNVVATYRSGIGLAGEVEAGSLTILQSKPLGLKSVTNPLAASGAADPEKMENARSHAPLTVRTLDRIVSVDDYQDFASAFAGIGKAQAVDLWSGSHHLVYVTIAGADGKPVTDQKFLDNFNAALDAARDPAQQVKVGTFDQLLFDLSASIAVDRRYVKADVFTAVQATLADAFSFEKRRFGQPVTAAEVMTVIQEVPGVVFVDLSDLYFSSGSPAPNQILAAATAYADNQGNIQNAQLLLINTLGVNLQEVKA